MFGGPVLKPTSSSSSLEGQAARGGSGNASDGHGAGSPGPHQAIHGVTSQSSTGFAIFCDATSAEGGAGRDEDGMATSGNSSSTVNTQAWADSQPFHAPATQASNVQTGTVPLCNDTPSHWLNVYHGVECSGALSRGFTIFEDADMV
jgi:hypothetical protein